MNQKNDKLIYWLPRILSILFIIFLSLFSLDVFNTKLGFWETVAGLLMHNIPTFGLLVVLLVAWRNGLVGGIFFILFALFYIIMTAKGVALLLAISWSLVIALPALIIGILFIIGWFKKK